MNELKQIHTVAAVQLKASGTAEQNMAAAETQIARAAEQGAELIVLPEHFVYYNEKDLSASAELEADPSGPARSFFAEQAREHKIWLVAGTLPMFKGEALKGQNNAKPYATSLLYDPQGKESARYEKTHLFDVLVQATGKRYYESDSYQPGDQAICATTDVGTLGMSVCYDLRFPEYYRLLVDQGAEILAVPSAFTAATGEAHWRLLLQARAVENLCYVIGANICNRDHPSKPTWGGSAIIDPWGKVLAELTNEEGFIIAEIDRQRIKDLRASMPVLEHRRF
ncbi:MAG: carbon-nitrogen hydrolase family protein [Porticoccaceae bacterium]|nr:carbon-nitrogen hydrolase family protein [Porticoccaceae bacterium]